MYRLTDKYTTARKKTQNNLEVYIILQQKGIFTEREFYQIDSVFGGVCT